MMKIFTTKLLVVALFGLGLVTSCFANSKTLEEVGLEMHGGNPLSPTPESLVGQYLASTQASTVVRSFLNGPAGSPGVQKLAIALSDVTISEFIRLFGSGNNLSKNLFFVHHYPNAGTFYFVYKGKLGSYARMGQDLAFYSPGTMIIPILLDDEEAQRLEKFFELGSINHDLARSPWILTSSAGNYSATSSFQGCTNWVGQLPIGNALVSEYIFPSGDNGENPNIQPLINYDTPVGLTAEQDAVLRSVWTVPGHQQLGDLLYPEGHRGGEFTNVGWIAHVTLGRLDLDRVPFMFYEVRDHLETLPQDFPLHTSPY